VSNPDASTTPTMLDNNTAAATAMMAACQTVL
jgi:hypothetical protein